MAVNWAARRVQVVCYCHGKKGQYYREYAEADRTRIVKLEEALKGSRGQ